MIAQEYLMFAAFFHHTVTENCATIYSARSILM